MSLALAIEIGTAYREDNVDIKRWTHLGAGVSRIVFRGPDGNAYKVPFGWDRTDLNLHEAAVSAWCRQYLPTPGVIWPDFICHPFDGTWISEVTCFDNDTSVSPQAMRSFERLLQVFGVNDAIAGRNIFSCKGFIVPIDLGFHGMINANPWDPKYWEGRGTSLREVRDFLQSGARERRINPVTFAGCQCPECRGESFFSPKSY